MHYIAIVEDRPEISRSISRVIESRPDLRDIQLSACYLSAEEAIDDLPATRTTIVLMDIGLPKMDGIDCMLHLKEASPDLKFLMFTVFDTDDKLFTALKYGADGYILKEDGIIGVINAIKELIQGGAPMSKSIAQKVLANFREEKKDRQPLEQLTPRQNEIIQLIAEGFSNKEIANRLGLTEGTVKQQNHKIFKAMEVNNRVEASNRYRGLPRP